MFTEAGQGQVLPSSIRVLSSAWGPPTRESTGSPWVHADIRETSPEQKDNEYTKKKRKKESKELVQGGDKGRSQKPGSDDGFVIPA